MRWGRECALGRQLGGGERGEDAEGNTDTSAEKCAADRLRRRAPLQLQPKTSCYMTSYCAGLPLDGPPLSDSSWDEATC